MFHVITIATAGHFTEARRLWASLRNSGNACDITIFCDDAGAFRALSREGYGTVRELPEIKTLGVKRAKFTAYDIAMREGDFLYLDADTIVLRPITELTAHEHVTGCYDDLSAIVGIGDFTHPWPDDRDLENRRSINTGVFFAPSSRRAFFQELCARSLDDAVWNRYVLPGMLYDNAFLCAHLNLLDEPVDYVDAAVYNWQGLIVNGRLQVRRSGETLVNVSSGTPLSIAHFAGIPHPRDTALCGWPVEVTSLLSAMGTPEETRRDTAFVDFLGTLSADFSDPPADPLPSTMLNAVARETVDLFSTGLRRDYSTRRSYFADPATMVSIAHSLPYGKYRWNGLACGNAYLDGEEYNFLQRVVQQLGIKTAIETGAGETSILMKHLGVDVLSMESQAGPWLDRARNEGCRCPLVHFDHERAEFDPAVLRREVELFASGTFDLLLIDSPPGTRARSRVMDQIAAVAAPAFVMVHDALRDARNIFAIQQRYGLELAAFLPSERGFVLLASRSAGRKGDPGHLLAFDAGITVRSPRVRLELSTTEVTELDEGTVGLTVSVTNLGPETLSSRYANPIQLGYHWLTPRRDMLTWDGLRTPLPFDILPGGSAEFQAGVGKPPGTSDALLSLTLVQEGLDWFDSGNSENRLVVRMIVPEDGPSRIEPIEDEAGVGPHAGE